MSAPRWVAVGELGKEAKKTAASLAYAAASDFYNLFGAEQGAVLDAIVPQFTLAGSELIESVALEYDGKVVALHCGYDAASITSRQQVGMKALLDALDSPPEVQSKLRESADKMMPCQLHGAYLSRIAVAPTLRRVGLGSLVLTHWEEKAREKAKGLRFLLHVSSTNTAARAFYEQHGYRLPEGADKFSVVLLEKNV